MYSVHTYESLRHATNLVFDVSLLVNTSPILSSWFIENCGSKIAMFVMKTSQEIKAVNLD